MNPSAKIVVFLTLALVFLTIIPLYFYPLLYPPPSSTASSTLSDPNDDNNISGSRKGKRLGRRCDIFSGEWVPNPKAPYYTNESCWAIHDNQNCMKYGRPDTEFIKWRWKPYECELPIFNPFQFLEIVKGKSLAFIGDSLGRNQMQSLMCLLSRGEKFALRILQFNGGLLPEEITPVHGNLASILQQPDCSITSLLT